MGENPEGGAVVPQYLVAVIVNIVSFTYGIVIGWVSPMQPLLQANYTGTDSFSPLGEDAESLTDEDISWIGGFLCVGGIVGTPLYGYLVSAIGRKKSIIAVAVPFILSYLLILFASSTFILFVARFVAGLGGAGACVVVPMYVGETAQDNVRGVLGSYFNLFICAGILFSYVIGSYTSYTVLAVMSLIFPILFLGIAIWLPETPIYLLSNNKKDQALQSLLKLRGDNTDVINSELSTLSATLKDPSAGDVKPSFKDMISDAATFKGLVIGCVVLMVQQFSGISPIIAYTVAIFQASGSDISPNIATIIVGSLQLVGGILATILMDRAGRKFLLLLSSVGMALTLAPIAIFFHLKFSGAGVEFMQSIGWIPLVSMSIYIIVYALGFGPVPFVLLGELFSSESKSTASSFCVLYVWFLAFLLLKFFSNLSNLIGIDLCFGLFSICCGLGAIFTMFYIPETKGKSLEAILWELGGKRKAGSISKNTPLPLVNLDSKQLEEKKFDFPTERNGTIEST